MSRVGCVVPANLSVLLVIALAGCGAQPAAPTLEEVRAERSQTVTRVWEEAAASTAEYIERDWPEAIYPPVAFERWVEPDAVLSEVASCMDLSLGRTVGRVEPTGIFTLNARPATEDAWKLPVSHLRCSLEILPWTGLYPFGGPVEQRWVRHQLTVALPACVRRWGADIVIDDLDAAIDASVYPTSSGRSVTPVQSVWLVAELRRVDDATARQIRATCPDPGRILVGLGPPEIRP